MYPKKVPTYVKGQLFIRGPIPLEWLAKASRGSGKGKALHLAMLIWHKCGLEKQNRIVTVGSKELRLFGVERHAFYRAAKKLEELGLIEVTRKNGSTYRFKILDLPKPHETSAASHSVGLHQ